jgi:sensor histidine kinase YesM
VLIPLISAVMIVAVLAAASRLRAGQLAAERARSETIRAEREAIAARLALLNAQIEPHFLYNTLAHVRVLAGTDAPAAQRMIDSLIDYLRASSRNMVLPLVTLAQELESVRGYLAVMQQRLGDRLTVVWRIPAQAGDQLVPPAALQTLVENAIKHGIEPASAGGEIRIEAMPGDGGWLIEVSDTGAGFSSPPATRPGAGASDRGTGLANLSERLRLTMGGLAGVGLDRLSGTTRARLQLGPANRAAP